jgi:hypothetical protein
MVTFQRIALPHNRIARENPPRHVSKGNGRMVGWARWGGHRQHLVESLLGGQYLLRAIMGACRFRGGRS